MTCLVDTDVLIDYLRNMEAAADCLDFQEGVLESALSEEFVSPSDD